MLISGATRRPAAWKDPDRVDSIHESRSYSGSTYYSAISLGILSLARFRSNCIVSVHRGHTGVTHRR